MRILKKVIEVPRRVIGKVAEATREHARDALHRVLDRVEGAIGGHALAPASASPSSVRHIRKMRGHKKPRAERRRARHAAHTAG